VLGLQPKAGATIVDATFGLGGYTRAILAAAPCRVVGIDRDPSAIARGRAAFGLEQATAEIVVPPPARAEVVVPPAVAGEVVVPPAMGPVLVQGRFGEMEALLAALGIDRVDGVAFDLGVSSPQLDEAARGFSFRFDGPLDMRMGPDGPSAAAVVNSLGEAQLADIIWRYGEERLSRRVARAIVAARREAPIEGTAALARIVRGAVPAARDGIDPATRTFQALRIYVNDEIGELERGLSAAERLLRAGGRLAVVSFHSLEDRVVKAFLRERSGRAPGESRHVPRTAETRAPSFRLITSKPILPDAGECARNPRARSAKLRLAERTAAPAWPMDLAA
jgi:16S rRNA (cytosine1402-N4)-methyltransferase